jgi:hypothetical protein
MGRTSTVVLAVALVALTLESTAMAADVDWKMYGTASVEDAEICFYDAKGVTRPTNNLTRVWTKCVSKKALGNIDFDGAIGKSVVESAAHKVLDNYVPPIAMVDDAIDFNQALAIIQYEEIANIVGIAPNARLFYEINCPDRMIRVLSTYLKVKGKDSYINKPSDWKHVSPESNGATLLKLMCRM